MQRRFRVFVYLLAALPLALVEGALLLTGWIAIPLVAITPLVVPALVVYRVATGWLAWLEARLARALLDADAEPLLTSPGHGFWGSAAGIASDGAFWRQQVLLLLGAIVRSSIAVAELSLLAAGVWSLLIPLTYGASDPQIGSWHVDSLGRALLFVPLGLLALAIAASVLGPLGSLFRKVTRALLRPVPAAASPARIRTARRRALAIHAALAAGTAALLVLIWGLTGGAFWPVWVLLSLGLLLGLHAAAIAVLEHEEAIRRERLTPGAALAAAGAVLFSLFLIGVWAAAGSAPFWPVWAIVPLLAVTGVYVVLTRRSDDATRILALEKTRAGAVDAQDAELRRIERDLHDGAQARLVALGMSLGMAEQKLATDPAAAQALLAEARLGAQEALAELRDLARGIHPPVLADRGLAAALGTLADRSTLDVEVDVDLDARPAPAVETAAYFVAAESLANAAKHADAGSVEIRGRREEDALVLEVTDDGRGGADPAGAGLTGLRQRVEALDGVLTVASPGGGPTTVRAVIPCAW